MKEMYDWVEWFGELAKKINELKEPELLEKAKAVWGADEAINKYPEYGIDPLSFFYVLAGKITSKYIKKTTQPKIKEVFELKASLEAEKYYLPYPIMLALFFNGDEKHKENWKEGKKNCWKLFRQAVIGKLDTELFQKVLDINSVGLTKLTQTLFLINPEKFCPIDSTGPLALAGVCYFPNFKKAEKQIIKEKGGLDAYLTIQKQIKAKFPECKFYEINTLSHLIQHKKIEEKLTTNPQYWMINTYVYDDGDDYWDKFEENNGVWTGKAYPRIKEPKKGDIILVRSRTTTGKGIGVVYKNDYKDGWEKENKKIHVLWLTKKEETINQVSHQGFYQSHPPTQNTFKEGYPITFEILEKLTKRPSDYKGELNKIFYGPPGTGKTYKTISEAVKIANSSFYKDHKNDRTKIKKEFDWLKDAGQIAFITFHQSFNYEEFIEGIKPKLNEGTLSYKVEDGIFKKICTEAKANINNNYVLIIDEINRGNISKIFGELITLIETDKRIGNPEELTTQLPYSNDDFGVPNNLYIIGTMNTADRSLTLLDSALRRRFVFEEIMPDSELLKGIVVEEIDLAKMLDAINQKICEEYDREHQIGHSFFLELQEKPSIEKLATIFETKILPLLEEYFHDERDKINEILNNNGFYLGKEKQWEKDKSALRNAQNYQNIYKGNGD